ncbi:MAG: DUF4422 domain-containing protein [Slackia sp.]|nr:DUF4422 domain-containing protein [Slackia sp.]
MALFSIIIPCFNKEAYVFDCLKSVMGQTLPDWEAIVVDDGSTDGSLDIARTLAHEDKRIRVVAKTLNEGPHAARLDGLRSAQGDYILFLDADDELEPSCLEGVSAAVCATGADIVHFGMAVIADNGTPEHVETAFEAHANAPFPVLEQPAIMETVFSAEGGFARDWRVTQRAFSRAIASQALDHWENARLGGCEDGYEYFVLASFAAREATVNDVKGYRYHLGRGATNSNAIDKDAYLDEAALCARSCDATMRYAARDPFLEKLARDFKAKVMETLANSWHERVPGDQQFDTAEKLAGIIGFDQASVNLMRFVRDEAYASLTHDAPLEPHVREWKALAERFDALEPSNNDTAFKHMRSMACMHIDDIDKRSRFTTMNNQNIRIFVSAHKEVNLFDSAILQPVQVGAAVAGKRFEYMLHDDEGDNISALNPMYCELTAQYWAWKNVDADYYGFCHYRRYFNFSDTRYDENPFGEVIAEGIDESTQSAYGLDDETIRNVVEGYDVITTEFKDLDAFPGEFHTPLSQYDNAPKLHARDLRTVLDIVERRHPDFKEDIDAFVNGHRSCFCNMYILKKDVFFDYCSWLFPILEEFVAQTDMSLYSKEALRTPGHLSERLFNIYYQHHMRTKSTWKTKQLQCVHFERTDKSDLPEPLPASIELPVIPVVFASDDNYVPMLTTTVYSMLKNASRAYHYDVVVLERDISWQNKRDMRAFFAAFPNATVRFVNVGSIIGRFNLTTSNEHISIETYYRFLIQSLLPFYSKVLYLDSDLIVEGDVSELYERELGDNLLAAAHDIDYLGNLNMPDGIRMRYTRETLGMADPYAYFQAGVLLINTEEMRKLHPIETWLDIASNPSYIYNDQDVLNAHCQGRVAYLPYEWNVMHDCGNRIANVFSFAPAAAFDAYNASRGDQKIIHYAGNEKPWNTPKCDQAVRYWEYAKETPFHEKLIAILCDAEKRRTPTPALPPKAISETNPIRKIVDPLMPLGSRRRETAKSIGRAIRGRN